jgi:hypothetical protein
MINKPRKTLKTHQKMLTNELNEILNEANNAYKKGKIDET